MRKMTELRRAIEQKNTQKALELCDELYTDLRDFCECIDIYEANGRIDVKMNVLADGFTTKVCRKAISDWVGEVE